MEVPRGEALEAFSDVYLHRYRRATQLVHELTVGDWLLGEPVFDRARKRPRLLPADQIFKAPNASPVPR